MTLVAFNTKIIILQQHNDHKFTFISNGNSHRSKNILVVQIIIDPWINFNDNDLIYLESLLFISAFVYYSLTLFLYYLGFKFHRTNLKNKIYSSWLINHINSNHILQNPYIIVSTQKCNLLFVYYLPNNNIRIMCFLVSSFNQCLPPHI